MAQNVANGTQTATVTTEHTLSSGSAAGDYQLLVDMSNLADGDIVEIRVKTKVLSADSSYSTVFMGTYANAQGSDRAIVASPPLMCPCGYSVSLKQTAGTSRDFKWSLNKP